MLSCPKKIDTHYQSLFLPLVQINHCNFCLYMFDHLDAAYKWDYTTCYFSWLASFIYHNSFKVNPWCKCPFFETGSYHVALAGLYNLLSRPGWLCLPAPVSWVPVLKVYTTMPDSVFHFFLMPQVDSYTYFMYPFITDRCLAVTIFGYQENMTMSIQVQVCVRHVFTSLGHRLGVKWEFYIEHFKQLPDRFPKQLNHLINLQQNMRALISAHPC